MIEPAFSLVDHDGQSVSDLSYRGTYLLVFFGFTHCKVVCPRALARLTGILARLDRSIAERITPLYISVDPERDTPAAMKVFLATAAPDFTGLTGTRDQVDQAKSSFRVFAQRREDPDAPDGYVVPHTAISYFIGPTGQYRTHFSDTMAAASVIEQIISIIKSDEFS